MRRQFNNIVSVIHSAIRFGLVKIFGGGDFQAGLIERFSPNVVFEKNRGAKVFLGKKVRAHSGCKIKARNGSFLRIGDNVKINYNCMIICRKEIVIGEGTEFGPSVFLYDHDHDYRAGLKEGKFQEGSITIGKDCWIGANTVILRGTKLGDHCVVAAGSVLHGEYPDHTMIYQKRETLMRPYEKENGRM